MYIVDDYLCPLAGRNAHCKVSYTHIVAPNTRRVKLHLGLSSLFLLSTSYKQ